MRHVLVDQVEAVRPFEQDQRPLVLAEEPERLGRFLSLTGINPESLRDAANEPNFLLGVLDYVASDDLLLQEFATQRGIAAALVMKARDLLAGAPPAAG